MPITRKQLDEAETAARWAGLLLPKPGQLSGQELADRLNRAVEDLAAVAVALGDGTNGTQLNGEEWHAAAEAGEKAHQILNGLRGYGSDHGIRYVLDTHAPEEEREEKPNGQ